MDQQRGRRTTAAVGIAALLANVFLHPLSAQNVALRDPVRPQKSAAARPAPPDVPATRDVRLDGGTFRGLLVDAQAMPIADREITVWQRGQAVARTRTGDDGRFTVGPVAGGAFTLVAGRESASFRGWVAGTEPPAAVAEALVVEQGDFVRGQFLGNDAIDDGGGFWTPTRGVIIVAGIAGAVTAIVLNQDDDDDDDDVPASP